MGLRTVIFVFVISLMKAPVAVAQSAQPKSVGALGDSISRAFNSGGLVDTPRNSWSTGHGRHVVSHRHLVADLAGKSVTSIDAVNAARSGATSKDLARQVEELARRSGSLSKVDYVTLLIGANDICDWHQDFSGQAEEFHTRVRAAVQKLVAANSHIKILLSPIPDMYQLWQLGTELGCQAKWNVTGFCSALLGKNRTTAERQMFTVKWRTANDLLQDVADEYPDNVRFAENAQYVAFGAEHISRLDCFHPSVAGQNMLSEVLWSEGWYN